MYSSNSTIPTLLQAVDAPGQSDVIKVGPEIWGRVKDPDPQLEM